MMEDGGVREPAGGSWAEGEEIQPPLLLPGALEIKNTLPTLAPVKLPGELTAATSPVSLPPHPTATFALPVGRVNPGVGRKIEALAEVRGKIATDSAPPDTNTVGERAEAATFPPMRAGGFEVVAVMFVGKDCDSKDQPARLVRPSCCVEVVYESTAPELLKLPGAPTKRRRPSPEKAMEEPNP